jgi:hypothetical protein
VKLLTYLMGINVPNLKTIAARVGHFTAENSKQRLASGILKKLTRREDLDSIVTDLSDNADAVLRFMILRPKDHWQLRDFSCFRQIWSEPEIFQAASELVNSGLIGVSYEKGADTEIYFCFAENFSLVREIVGADVSDPLTPARAPAAVHAYPETWKNDLLTLLGYCLKREIQMTQSGLPHRRDIKSLEPLILGERLRPLFQRFVDTEFDWIEGLFRTLRRVKAVGMDNGVLQPCEGGLQAIQDLLLEARSTPDRGLLMGMPDHAWETDLIDVCRYVNEAKHSDWLSVEALENSIYPVREVFESGAEPAMARIALFKLMTMGRVDLGEGTEGWVWRPSGRQEEVPDDATGLIHVQPNYEIVAAANLPVSSRAVLERIAQLESIDHQLMHYKITRESVYSGLCNGWSAEDQVTWYNRQLGPNRALPQNVAHSIESWGAAYGRVSLEHPLLLVCDSPKLAEQLYHSKEIANYCLGRFSETALVIRRDAEEEVLASLQTMGLLPDPKIGSGLRWAIETREPGA